MIKFDFKDGKVIVRADQLTVAELRAVWDYDESASKTLATDMLTYVYLVADGDSPFADLDADEREPYAKRNCFSASHKFSAAETKMLKSAIAMYYKGNEDSEKRFRGVYNKLIDDIRKRIEKVNVEFVRNVERTGKISFSSNIALVTKASTDLQDLLEARDKLDARIARGAEKEGKIKGGKKPSLLESGKVKFIKHAKPAA